MTLTLADGTLIEGVVDLAFEEAGQWVVVDYKTDRELSGAPDRSIDGYRLQVAAYTRAVSLATSKPATAILMRV